MSFYTVIADYNGPLAVDMTRINIATNEKVAKYGGSSTLILTLSGRVRSYIVMVTLEVCMSRVYLLLYYRYQL